MRRVFLITGFALGIAVGQAGFAQQSTDAPAIPGTGSTADHSKFEILQKEFASGPEVTEACMTCHTEADDQIMHSIHFEWEFKNERTGQMLGKRNVINAFCGSVAGNEPRCTSCHAGYGWEDMNVSPVEAKVTPDCLVCHDRSGQYTKTATTAGHPPLAPVPDKLKTITGAKAWAVDLGKAARSVGNPTRANCGNCHFYGGGGDNVKHGDLSSALYNPERAVDVHMSPDGEDFTCSTCHVSDQHSWAGSRYLMQADSPHGTDKPGAARTTATCESCHTATPHEASLTGMKLNDHTDTLACQTCHIPEFARGNVSTKTVWDWSTAGKLDDNGNKIAISDYLEADGDHRHTYMSTKGTFEWEENVEPIYEWFNGVVEYTTGDKKIDPSKTVEINPIQGTPDAEDSRIWPFKRMEGRQAYDSVLNELVYTHVWGPDTDTALWTNFDWDKAIKAGMEAAGEDYSGEYAFVDTHMFWPITHMVAPAEEALQCESCHSDDGRMQGLTGVNMPGTSPFNTAGMLGLATLLAALLGVLIHATIRILRRSKSGGHHG
jgi:octaheme c-type cytochrome (tetrathionate reductase family)